MNWPFLQCAAILLTDANVKMNYADLDVAVIGPVVKEVSDEFDLYWNNESAIPITALAKHNSTPEQFAAQRAALIAHHETMQASAYAESLRDSEFFRQIRNRDVPFLWGKATIVADNPDKVVTSARQTEMHLAPYLRGLANKTKRELFLISPYFVPGKEGVELLAGVHQRGVRVVVITNSLASSDGAHVHAKYQLYRKPLVEAGIELYEINQPPARNRRGASASPLDRASEDCMQKRSPLTARSASSASTISIRAQAS